MKWEEDLIIDIRTHSNKDDVDYPTDFSVDLGRKLRRVRPEFSPCNHEALQKGLDIGEFKTFLEIGVCRNGDTSSTHTILKNIPKGGKFLGIDLEDKSFLDDHSKGIYTMKCNSSNFEQVKNKLEEIGVKSLDFIHIDGWHSINQVLDDWEYTRLLSNNGVVCFHDTTAHPGPYHFVRNLNPELWDVSILCESDHGFTICHKK